MHLNHRVLEAIRIKKSSRCAVTIPDIRGQGCRTAWDAKAKLCRAVDPQRVLTTYFNRKTNKQNLTIYFQTEEDMARGLDAIDENFRRYRVL